MQQFFGIEYVPTWLWMVISALAGALLATVFWWLLLPAVLLNRWSRPVRRAIEEGFSENAAQMRLKNQAESVWQQRQQERWEHAQALHQRLQTERLLDSVETLIRSIIDSTGGIQPASHNADHRKNAVDIISIEMTAGPENATLPATPQKAALSEVQAPESNVRKKWFRRR